MTHTQKDRHLKVMNLALFCVWGGARVWAFKNHSFDSHLNYLGPVSCYIPSLRVRHGVAAGTALADG